MAEGDGVIYNEFKRALLEGEIDLSDESTGDTIKVILVTGYTPDIDTDLRYEDVSGVEEAGSGYSAGGETLASQSVTKDTGNDLAYFDGDNVTWSSLDVGTPSHAVMYDSSLYNTLMAYWEVTTVTNGGDYTLAWNASGIISLS